VPHDHRPVHDLSAGQQHRIRHQRVHQGVLELVRSVRHPVVRLLVVEQDPVGLGGERLEPFDLDRRLDREALESRGGVVEQLLPERSLQHTGRLDRGPHPQFPSPYLVSCQSGGELVAVQMQVDVDQLAEQPPRLPPVLVRVPHFEVLALGAAQLLQVEVQHRRQPVDELRPQEGLLDVDRQVVEHVDGLPRQGEVRAALSLVRRQLSHPALLLLGAHLGPPVVVADQLLHLVYPLEALQRLVQQERGVVHEHVDEFDELLAGLGLVDEGLPVDGRVPHALNYQADVIPD
jgi:hypothetical protein